MQTGWHHHMKNFRCQECLSKNHHLMNNSGRLRRLPESPRDQCPRKIPRLSCSNNTEKTFRLPEAPTDKCPRKIPRLSCSNISEKAFLSTSGPQGDELPFRYFSTSFLTFCICVLYFVAIGFYIYSIQMIQLIFFFFPSDYYFLSHCVKICILLFILCRHVDITKWRTVVIRSVWIRIIT